MFPNFFMFGIEQLESNSVVIRVRVACGTSRTELEDLIKLFTQRKFLI